MKIPTKTGYLIAYGLIALCIILVIITGIQTCQQFKSIEAKVQEKIDRETKTPTIIITAHDIATAKAIDSTEDSRRRLNLRIDAASQPQLQSWLDSVYNFPGYPEQRKDYP